MTERDLTPDDQRPGPTSPERDDAEERARLFEEAAEHVLAASAELNRRLA
ncbi:MULTISPECIES: hypothetical protein [unclassified Streptomyces]|nr:hypothetical protein [Streptomyces sp. SID4985]MYQ44749.1 hypothetical protein [Streptomyces sp. SID4985]